MDDTRRGHHVLGQYRRPSRRHLKCGREHDGHRWRIPTAIDGITLSGALYNITFTSTGAIPNDPFPSSLDFNDLSSAVVQSIDTDLGMSMFGPIGSGLNIFYVAVPTAIPADAGIVESNLESNGRGGYFWQASVVEAPWPCNNGATPCTIPAGEIFAEFTPVVSSAPEPAAGTPTLAGPGVIAVLMWKRR